MEAGFGPGTNPIPYILLAYFVGTLGLFGFAAWVLRERLALKKAQRSLSGDSAKGG